MAAPILSYEDLGLVQGEAGCSATSTSTSARATGWR